MSIPTPPSPPNDPLREYIPYLVFIGESLVPKPFRGKVDVEGAVQQALVEAWKAPVQGNSLAWLKNLMICNLRDQLRRLRAAKRGGGMIVSLDTAMKASSQMFLNLLRGDDPTPSTQEQINEQEAQLARAIALLPERQRQALRLCYWDGLTLSAAGEQLGSVPASTVAGLVRRGLETLRKHFQGGAE